MIGKAKSNKSLSATIEYNLKEAAALIYQNKMEGNKIADFRLQMEDLQKCYKGYGRQLTLHAILSPAIEDGKKLSKKQWQEIADSYLKKMQLQQQQAIGFLHTDKGHKHLHLVINKVGEQDFKLYHDTFIGKKSQMAADTIALEMQLVRARQVMQKNKLEKTRLKDAKSTGVQPTEENKSIGTKQLFKTILENISKNKFANPTAFFNALKKVGFKVYEYPDKETGGLRGYGIEKHGTKMDASSIGKQFTLKALGLAAEGVGVNHVKESIANDAILKPLQQADKITILEQFALDNGITKDTLLDHSVEMVELGNKYFIAMKNDSGGYALNNVFACDTFGDSDITSIIKDIKQPIVVVDDMFAYLKCKDQYPDFSFIILHSVLNTERAIKKLLGLNAGKITLALNNDAVGKAITQKISSSVKNSVDCHTHILSANREPQSLNEKQIADTSKSQNNDWDKGR
jgi:Relaxase/Mobilisation nuclease domain